MKKLILMGRSEAGKTSLKQALSGEKVHYYKTQYIHYGDVLIDTPGEYAQTHHLGYALALYAYEADVVGLLVSATEPYTLFPPNITCMVNREVIGIVSKINDPKANVRLAELWLRNAGCKTIFFVDSVTGEGVDKILEHLNTPKTKKTTKLAAEQRESAESAFANGANVNKGRKTTENDTKPTLSC